MYTCIKQVLVSVDDGQQWNTGDVLISHREWFDKAGQISYWQGKSYHNKTIVVLQQNTDAFPKFRGFITHA